MPVYEYKGKYYDLPDGLTKEQALNKIKTHLGEAAEDQSQAETNRLASKEKTQEPVSMVERMFGLGSPSARFLKGYVADPALGLYQTVVNAAAVPGPLGYLYQQATGKDIPIFGEAKRGVNQAVSSYSEATEEARKRVGSTGLDPFQITGAIFSPANKLLGGVEKAMSFIERVGRGAAAGAGFAAMAPTSGKEDSYVDEKLSQMGVGAIIGGSVPFTVDVAKQFVRIIKDLPISEAAKQRALQKYVVELAGDKPDIAAKALREAGELVPGSKPTAAQALADTPSAAKLVREQSRVSQEVPELFIERAKQQAAARQSELGRMFGTADDIAALQAERTAVTTPMREQALAWADVYGKTAPKLQASIDKATEEIQKFMPRAGDGQFYTGRQKAIHNYISKNREFKQAQLDSLRENGFFPLSIAPIAEKIEKSRGTIGERSNELLQDAQSRILDKLRRFSDENGIIPSKDLYNIRKEIGEDIQAFLMARGVNPSFSGQATSVEKALKAQLDDAIVQASGSNLWKDYLANFSKYSEKINQMQVGQELQKRLAGSYDKQAAGAFAEGIKSAPTLIKRATGQNRYQSLEEIFTKEQLASVNRVYADLLRKSKAEEVARAAKVTGRVPFEGEQQLPQVLYQPITIAKSVLNTLRMGSQEQLDKQLADLMLNPQKLASFLENIPKKDASNVAQALMAKASPETAQQFKIFMDQLLTQGQVTRGVTQGMLAE